MTAPSAADLAATVRAGIRIHPDEPTDVMVDLEARALAALDDLVARCEQLGRERDLREAIVKAVEAALFGTDMGRSRDEIVERAEAAERERDEARRLRDVDARTLLDAVARAEQAERERDEAREWGHRQADLLTECATACEAAEARVAQLEARIAAMPYETEEETE